MGDPRRYNLSTALLRTITPAFGDDFMKDACRALRVLEVGCSEDCECICSGTQVPKVI